MACFLWHSWNGCICKKCGATRDEGHEWEGCKCSRCGKTRNEQHDWVSYICSRCGRKRDINEINNELILADIAKNDKDKELCISAIRKINTQSVLFDIVLNGKHIDVRLFAVNRLEDQVLLASIAEKGVRELRLSTAALNKREEESFLSRYANKDDDADYHIRCMALDKMKIDITEFSQIQLKCVVYAKWRTDHKRAISALDLITDQSLLKSMSYWVQYELGGRHIGPDTNSGVVEPLWIEACRRITDKDILKEIIATGNGVMQYTAENRLLELEKNNSENDGRF